MKMDGKQKVECIRDFESATVEGGNSLEGYLNCSARFPLTRTQLRHILKVDSVETHS